MKVVLSATGRFHFFDLARQLHKRGWLECIFTGYPKFKLRNEELPADKIRSFPWLHSLYMKRGRLGLTNERLGLEMAHWSHRALEAYIAARMPACDIYMGLTGTGLKGGRLTKRRGGVYVCDRGSSHLRYQAAVLKEEFARHQVRFQEFDPRGLRIEDAEYAAADVITVPSSFARRSFVERGVSAEKVIQIPYGVDLSRFYPDGHPDEQRFDVISAGTASLQKGTPYLLESFARVRHPRKHLTLAGVVKPEVAPMLRRYAAEHPITCIGPVPQSELRALMSRSHVLVQASVQEGLALVQAQAMACGCPVIGTTSTGAEDLFQDGEQGYIVPIRDPEALANRMQALADDPTIRIRLSHAALQRVESLGGWDRYGAQIAELFCRLIGEKPR